MSGVVMIRLFVRNDYKPATSMLLVRLNWLLRFQEYTRLEQLI